MPEAALLSTCNRTELYVAANDAHAAAALAQPALEWLALQGGMRPMNEVALERCRAAQSTSFAMDLAKWTTIMEAYLGGEAA